MTELEPLCKLLSLLPHPPAAAAAAVSSLKISLWCELSAAQLAPPPSLSPLFWRRESKIMAACFNFALPGEGKSVCVRARACVCVCEREREREVTAACTIIYAMCKNMSILLGQRR